MGNVVGRPDRHGNLCPAKQRPERKIGAAVALMMAIGRSMAADAGRPDIGDFLRALLCLTRRLTDLGAAARPWTRGALEGADEPQNFRHQRLD